VGRAVAAALAGLLPKGRRLGMLVAPGTLLGTPAR